MKHNSNSLNKIIKKSMIAVSLFLTVFFSAKEAHQAAGRLNLKEIQTLVGDGVAEGASMIWRHQYPAAVWDKEGEGGKALYQENSIGSLFCGFFFRYSPLSRYAGESQEAEVAYGEEDPAYKSYLESGKFYEEHSFLLYDGGEESGEDGSVNAQTHKVQSESETGVESETSIDSTGNVEAGAANAPSHRKNGVHDLCCKQCLANYWNHLPERAAGGLCII